MTASQTELLKILIERDRQYFLRLLENEWAHRDERGVEVNRAFGCDPRTARALEVAGLVEIVEIRPFQKYVFLGSYDPFRDKE